MNLLQDLASLPQKCIYGLFNDVDKKVYIGYTKNTITSIYSNMDLKYSNKDFNKLEFRIIETIEDADRLRIRYQYWVSDYSNKGWGMYRDYKAVGYKVKVVIRNNEVVKFGGKFLLYVKLVSRGHKELTVGVFDDIDLCDKFVLDNYSNIEDIIYCDNVLTDEYRRSLK